MDLDGLAARHEPRRCAAFMQQDGKVDRRRAAPDDNHLAPAKPVEISVRRAVRYQLDRDAGQFRRNVLGASQPDGDDDGSGPYRLAVVDLYSEAGRRHGDLRHGPAVQLRHIPPLKCESVAAEDVELDRQPEMLIRAPIFLAILPKRIASAGDVEI